jgi:hypothetical protein
MYQDYPLLGVHGHLSYGCKAGLLQDFPEESIGFSRVVRYQENVLSK